MAFDFDEEKGLVYHHCFICSDPSPTHNLAQILCIVLEGPKGTYEESKNWIRNCVKQYGEYKPSWKFVYDEITKYDSDEDPKEMKATISFPPTEELYKKGLEISKKLKKGNLS